MGLLYVRQAHLYMHGANMEEWQRASLGWLLRCPHNLHRERERDDAKMQAPSVS